MYTTLKDKQLALNLGKMGILTNLPVQRTVR